MAKFQKSKFRNGQRISHDAKWTDVDMRSVSGDYRRGSRGSSGILGNALGNAVRRAVKESLRTPHTPEYDTDGYTPKVKEVQDPHRRTTLSISEMPEELRYLSYPHLKPKEKVEPQPEEIVWYTPEPVSEAKPEPVPKYPSFWDLFLICLQFFKDLFGSRK